MIVLAHECVDDLIELSVSESEHLFVCSKIDDTINAVEVNLPGGDEGVSSHSVSLIKII